jgi:hypothetical protein
MFPRLLPLAALFLSVASIRADTFIVTNANNAGPGSLRQAITDANAHQNVGTVDRINYNISGAGVHTIVLASNLPDITGSVFLDGWSQPGFQGKPLIEVTTVGQATGNGLNLRSDFITVRGLIINRFVGGIGIFIDAVSSTAVQGCYIGTDADGLAAAPNAVGIFIRGGSHNLIGGSGKGAGNLISGNISAGIMIEKRILSGIPDMTPRFNTIQGNFIGTDVTGTVAVPNYGDGIYISGRRNSDDTAQEGHKIGGTIRGAGNVISGNRGDGIFAYNVEYLRIQGNRIGTGADGVTPVGNQGNGFQLVSGAGCIIGPEVPDGPNLDAANTIAYNGGGTSDVFTGNGILFQSAPWSPIPGRVSANSIHDNVKLGIDLGADGVTPNDPGDTGEQNFPVISAAFGFNGQLTVYGSLNSLGFSFFTLEFFASHAADSSGFGEGQIFLGQAKVATDSSGNALFNVTFPLPPNITVVTATTIGPFIRISEFSAAVNISPSAPPQPPTSPTTVMLPVRASQLLNLSTRLKAGTGDDVMIGGFVVSGTQPKKIMVRGLGPSLGAFNVPGILANPTLDLYDASNELLARNDNWRDTQETEVQNSGLAPTNDSESAIVRTVPPGNYTAVLRGGDKSTGIALVEVYDLDEAATSNLGNVSARGFVGTGDDVIVAGFIAGGVGGGATTVAIRGLGPALASFGITNFLADPTLELRNGSGTLVEGNGEWGNSTRFDDIRATGLAPENAHEAMVLYEASPGNYTAILRGTSNGTGVGLLEIYNFR